jgi:endogenous inhibitor of DNA gyrase (YacG/DUF329 family)
MASEETCPECGYLNGVHHPLCYAGCKGADIERIAASYKRALSFRLGDTRDVRASDPPEPTGDE